MPTKFPHIFSPLTIGSITLPNRILMGSMHTGLEDNRRDYEKLAAYLAERAQGGVGLMVTGGIAPNVAGWIAPFAGKLTTRREVPRHRLVTKAVHQHGAKICMQILHAGRYGYSPLCVAPSPIASPISPFSPRELSTEGVERQIRAFVRCAKLAGDAGYDGVEIMGSEGYLINQFLVAHTNKRTDHWGGSFENRIRFPLEIVRRTRAALGEDFIVIFRLSMLDLVDGGGNWDEVVALAKELENAGVSLLNTGIGWHEARIPTIATSVPPGAFSWVTGRLKEHVSTPLIATNRINTPQIAEDILASGQSDMVSMARPFLADPALVNKARNGIDDQINTCIGCNQACLDHIFAKKRATCLVNPRACYETELIYAPVSQPANIAVVGAGPAGMACATVLAQRGHEVILYEAAERIGGQFNIAMRVPGKSDFAHTLRYFRRLIDLCGVNLQLGCRVSATDLVGQHFDHVVIATGATPRMPAIPGIEHPKVLSYLDVLQTGCEVGGSVAIVGAGGIGFDVADFLSHHDRPGDSILDAFLDEWGIDRTLQARAGLRAPSPLEPDRQIYLMQRRNERLGKGLGKTTGWIHRTKLRNRNVKMLSDVTYQRIDDYGLHILRGNEPQVLDVEHVVICAGQESERSLVKQLQILGVSAHVIGGAERATELDAKRAIDQGSRLGALL